MVEKNGFFGPMMAFIPKKRGRFREVGRDLMKMNGSLIANPDAADPPAITIPEPLPLPDAGFAVAGIDHIGRAAIAGSIIARAVIVAVLRSNRAADNGTAEQAGCDA